MGFKDNLQYLRGSHNMTQEQLAMLIGVSRQSVSKWESEKAYPEMDKLLMLCDMFGVSLDDLVMGDVRNGIAMSANHVEDGLPKAPMPEMEGSALPQDITGYEEHMRKFDLMIPTGVSAIIFGVSIGNLFDSDNSILGNSDANEVAMFLCIAIGTLVGLALLIPAGLAHSAFKRQHPYVEDFYTESDRAAARKVLAIALIAGIALIMAGIAVNVWADETLHVDEGWPSTALLMFVAVGVWCIVFGGMQYGRLDIADYNKESEEQHVQENGTESIYDKGNGAVCGIIMITAPIVGLTLLFCFDGGPHGMFWMSWVIDCHRTHQIHQIRLNGAPAQHGVGRILETDIAMERGTWWTGKSGRHWRRCRKANCICISRERSNRSLH